MAYLADYRVVDGMTFVRVKTPKGSVVSYGKTSSIALGNLANKYGTTFKERIRICLGNVTNDPLETMVTVKRNKNSEWWYRHREQKGVVSNTIVKPTPSIEEQDGSEYIYEVVGGELKVYRLTLEKSYKVKQTTRPTPVSDPFKVTEIAGGYHGKLPAEPGMVLFNSNGGNEDVA